MNKQIDASQNDQAKEHAPVELQSSSESPTSAELLFGCSTGDHRFDVPTAVVPLTHPKHSRGLSGITEEYTGMSTPLSVATEYRPQQ